MPRYYFDIQDDVFQPDDEGTECDSIQAVRQGVMASLPDLAELITSSDRDNQTVAMTVRDENGAQIYKATLSFVGQMLNEAASS